MDFSVLIQYWLYNTFNFKFIVSHYSFQVYICQLLHFCFKHLKTIKSCIFYAFCLEDYNIYKSLKKIYICVFFLFLYYIGNVPFNSYFKTAHVLMEVNVTIQGLSCTLHPALLYEAI